MDMESPLKYVARDLPHLPTELIAKIYSYLPKDRIMSAKFCSRELRKELSSYHFASSFRNNHPNLSSPKVLLFDDNVFFTLRVDHPSTSQVAYTKLVTVPSPISDLLKDDDDDDDDDDDNDEECDAPDEECDAPSDEECDAAADEECVAPTDEECMHAGEDNLDLLCPLNFHGSTSGLICLTIEKRGYKSGYFIWNPTIGKCCEIPRFSGSDSEVFGMGHAGDDGNIEIVCISGAHSVGDPIVINCLNVSNRQWETIHTDAVFMGTDPCYVGVAGDVLLWGYRSINAEFINAELLFTGYNFRTRSIITIQKPSLLPPSVQLQQIPQGLDPNDYYSASFYVAANSLWALGEDRDEGFNFLRRYMSGAWEIALDSFDIPSVMVNQLMGSSADFNRLLFLTNQDHLILFHSVPEGDDYPITFVDSPDPNGVNLPADSASQTVDFLDPRSIEFEETLFFPDVAEARNIQTESLKKEEEVHELIGARKDVLAAAVLKHSEGSDFHVEENASVTQNEKCGDDSSVVQALDVAGAWNMQTESLNKEEEVRELIGATKDELAAAVPKH